MRSSNDRLVLGISSVATRGRRKVRALRRWFEGYAGELHHHHLGEDTIYFPALAERVPSYRDYGSSLDDDHRRLDRVLQEVGVALTTWVATPDSTSAKEQALRAAVELRDLLAIHLETEDRDVLPMFERHFTVHEFDTLNDRRMKALPLKQALFTVPWFMFTVEPTVAAATMATAPAPLKIVFRLTRGGYTRLCRRAFGGAS